MASSERQLRNDVEFGPTARNAGVVARIEVRLYDSPRTYAIGNTPRNGREEVLTDLAQILDLLEHMSAQREGTETNQ